MSDLQGKIQRIIFNSYAFVLIGLIDVKERDVYA